MGDFKKSGKKGDTFNRGSGGWPSFASRPGFNRGGGERREMFKATCAECGRPAEVPFRPSGDRPVYCKECFQSMGGASAQNRDERGGRDSRGPSHFQKREFTPRPSYAPPAQGSGEDKRLDDLKIQLATANSKLDTLLNMLGNIAHTMPKTASPAKPGTLHDTLAKVIPSAVSKKESAKSKSAAPSAKKKTPTSKKK